MPYTIKKIDGKWCVFNKDTGENKGCSDTKRMALAHMRALYWAENKKELEQGDIAQVDNVECEDCNEKEYPVSMTEFFGAKSYAELFDQENERKMKMEISEILYQFPYLAGNIIAEETGNKVDALKALADELVGIIADRLGGNQGENNESEEKEVSPLESEDNIVKRVVDRVKQLFLRGEKDEQKDNGMMIWKESDGSYRWIAKYSNTFRDRDNPPEIISSESHKKFVEMVDKGLAPYPELWIWHTKEWKIGEATWLAYDEIGDNCGYAVAAGYIYPQFEQVAEWLMNKEKDIRVSHGMPESSIRRDEGDPSIITQHETREISILPSWAAANYFTGFITYKEADMTLPKNKREQAKRWGISDELLDYIETMNLEEANKALSEGVQTKEAGQLEESNGIPDEQEQDIDAASNENSIDDNTKEDNSVHDEDGEMNKYEELISTIKEISNALVAINNRLDKIEANASEKELNQKEGWSLAQIIAESAIGNKEAIVDGREKIAKLHPKESDKAVETITGIPFIDSMLSKQ